MQLSGFTFLKNASKLYYPVKESILSILPIVDEFVIALGDNDEDDTTEELLASINSDKIKIVRTSWDTESFPRNSEYARQTDIAKSHCTGDWLFYLQSDEVVHEEDHQTIIQACDEYLYDMEVEGFIFKYLHFWGDYDHHNHTHAHYHNEIRIIRNVNETHSWKDAQSFRYIENFTGHWSNYFEKQGTRKLNVVSLDAHIYHYGGVRPPDFMAKKNRSFRSSYYNDSQKEAEQDFGECFDYGPLDRMATFEEVHPAIMQDRIADFDWGDQLQYSGKPNPDRPAHKHEKLKSRVLTFIEQKILGGKYQIGGFHNYRVLQRN